MSEQNVSTNFEELKNTIAENLVKFRRLSNFTQQELAEKINYSDKAVSKWERGDGIPDVIVLKALADIYGITVNDFLIKHQETPAIKRSNKNLAVRRWLISLLSAGLVWFVATVVTVLWQLIDSSATVAKYAYIAALPISFIVLLIFSCVWGKLWQTFVSVSGLIWTLCLLINVILTLPNAWLIYLIGAALQLLFILWVLLRYVIKRDKFKHEKIS